MTHANVGPGDSVSTQAKHISAEELLQMPDDGLRYDLVNEELCASRRPATHKDA